MFNRLVYIRLSLVWFLIAGLLLTTGLDIPRVSASAAGPYRISGTRFVDGSGAPVFLFGANYEGHYDRAWLMWDDTRFDPGLIEQDFKLAAQLGINTVRIFVQPQLRDSINYGDWGKLDTISEIAQRQRISLLVTLQDYTAPNLTAEADLASRIASHYANNPGIMGYDLRNEPQFGEIASAMYPPGMYVPLQSDGFMTGYGERMSQAAVDAFRKTKDGANLIPGYLDSRQGYYFANAMRLWDEFQQAANNWSWAHPGKNQMDFIDSADSTQWKAFYGAVSGTVDKWEQIRLNAIRAADPDALITVGWNQPLLAKTRANGQLNFISYHNFPGEGYDGVILTLNQVESLRASFPDRPVVLEEFGYSNTRFDGSSVPQTQTANHEMALWLYLYWRGFAGGYKWMLTNFPPSFNRFEGGLGLLDDDNHPKLSYYSLKALVDFARNENYQSSLNMNGLQPFGTNVGYTFTGRNSLWSSSTSQQSGGVRFQQEQVAPLAVWWSGGGANEVYITATSNAQVWLDLNALIPGRNKDQPLRLALSNGQDGALQQDGVVVSFKVQPGQSVTLTTAPRNTAANKVQAAGNGALFFAETGHNLSGSFRTYWERTGGLAMYGYPLTEEFSEQNPQDGKTYTVQYFERARFEYHPENKGTNYEVLLGHLGRTVSAGREGEPSFRRTSLTSTPARLFFNESGHSLSGSFRSYWEKNGGLAQFGYPISEEFAELNPTDNKTYVVQYFERARFEYHPENKGTIYEVLLGQLGRQVLKLKGML